MGTLSVHTNRIDGAVHPDAAGEFENHLDWIFLTEIDHLRTLGAGHFQTIGNVINGQNARGTEQFGG